MIEPTYIFQERSNLITLLLKTGDNEDHSTHCQSYFTLRWKIVLIKSEIRLNRDKAIFDVVYLQMFERIISKLKEYIADDKCNIRNIYARILLDEIKMLTYLQDVIYNTAELS